MQKLYEKLKNYSIEDIFKIEENDRQFLALEKLEKIIDNKDLFFSLIIGNSLVCYQLSGKGEDYWEEFSAYFIGKNICHDNIIEELSIFIKNSKNNKRLINNKLKRLKKIEPFLLDFKNKGKYYYNNTILLRDNISNIMGQKNNAKTIVFTIKMFSYGARNIYGRKILPKEIFLPLDSRLLNLYNKYNTQNIDEKDFFLKLSKKLQIPLIHLDSLLWINYGELIL